MTGHGSGGVLPLVIGLGGHRDLRPEDVPTLEARVAEVLGDLQRRYPSTPLTLLCSLAEGADRLGARVALRLGARLVVPLPLPREEYERDFATAESRAEFADLLGRAQDVFRVDVLSDRPREYAYARTAAYVTQRSQLVVALWDGTPPASHAGTASLVQFALDGVPEGYGEPKSPLDTAERRPVAHIMTPRRDASSSAASAHVVRWLYPDEYGDPVAAAKAFDELWTRIDELNRDAARALPPSAIAGSDLLDAALAGTLSPRLREAHGCYAAADALSIHFQRRTRRTLGWLLVLAFVAAAALQGDPLARAAAFSLNGLYVGALAAAYAVWLWSRRARYQTKYLDYRALAEGLRVQIFWRLAGIPDAAADHYLRKQRSELDWIRRAMRGCDVGSAAPADASATSDVEPLRLVLERWVRPQRAYFTSAARKNDGRYQKIKRFGYAFFGVALALAFAKPFLSARNPLLVAVSLVPVIAALTNVWADRLALAPLAKQYGRMSHVFAAADDALDGAIKDGNAARGRAVIHELGVEALAENADWVLLHRDRPVSVPGAK
jgi:hypothetical protein